MCPLHLAKVRLLLRSTRPFCAGRVESHLKGQARNTPARMSGAIVPFKRIMIRFLQPLTQRYNAGRKDVFEMTILRASEATTMLFFASGMNCRATCLVTQEPVGQISGHHWRRCGSRIEHFCPLCEAFTAPVARIRDCIIFYTPRGSSTLPSPDRKPSEGLSPEL